MKPSHIFVYLFLLLFCSSCFFSPLPFDEEQWEKTVEKTRIDDLYEDNSKKDQFFNPWLPQRSGGFSRFLRWRFSQKADYSEDAEQYLPQILPNLPDRIKSLPAHVNFIAWIGHATFLIRLDHQYWLTDPIFSNRALLPKRVTPPALRGHELSFTRNNLHVLISHNHYDHLDKKSLENLPSGTKFYVPKGLQGYVGSFAPGPVRELNWWDEINLPGGQQLTCLPAQHWSRRIFQSYNSTLWASYMIVAPSTTVYFGGDSGYFKGYSEIGRKYRTIDYALLPVTAYHPRWFMHYAHMNSSEAIRAFQDLRARHFIPSQWGTFRLGDNPAGLPPLDLLKDVTASSQDKSRYLILKIGEMITF